jgi:hypothetical protein
MRTLESHVNTGVFIYVERSKDCAKLFAALVKAQGEMEEPKKNRKGQYGEYADLAALRKASRLPLSANGLAVFQTFHMGETDMVLNTTLAHSSGEYLSSQTPLKTSQNPQQTMAYATYMRRMAYSAILALSSEDDDDGQGAADAAVSAVSQDQEALFRRAEKAIQTAATPAAADEVLRRVEARVAAGEMGQSAVNDLRKVAEIRKAVLSKSPAPKEQK